MAGMRCPHCGRIVGMPDYVLRADVVCPACRRTFHSEGVTLEFAQLVLNRHKQSARQMLSGVTPAPAMPVTVAAPVPPPPVVSPAVPPPPPAPPARTEPVLPPAPPPLRLAVNHTCHQCHGEITTPINKARTTIDCPLCQRRTSVYALQFRCPHRCDTLLESPLSKAGQTATCPQCQRPFTIPGDVIYREAPEPGPQWFTFRCTGCRSWLVAGSESVRKVGSCPLCRVVMEVPNCGYALTERRRLDGDDFKTIRCRHCLTKIPVAVTHCPCCGHAVPTEADFNR